MSRIKHDVICWLILTTKDGADHNWQELYSNWPSISRQDLLTIMNTASDETLQLLGKEI